MCYAGRKVLFEYRMAVDDVQTFLKRHAARFFQTVVRQLRQLLICQHIAIVEFVGRGLDSQGLPCFIYDDAV